MKKNIIPIMYKNNDILIKIPLFYTPLFFTICIFIVSIVCFVDTNFKFGVMTMLMTIIMFWIMHVAKSIMNRAIKSGRELRKRRELLIKTQVPYKGSVKKIIKYNDESYLTYTMLVECEVNGKVVEFESLEYEEDLSNFLASSLVDVYYDDTNGNFIVENLVIGSPCNIEADFVQETIDSEIKRERRQYPKKHKDIYYNISLYEFLGFSILLSLILFVNFEFSDNFVFTGEALLAEKISYYLLPTFALSGLFLEKKKKTIGTILLYLFIFELLLMIYLYFVRK